MARLNDKQRKQIIADYVELQNYRAVSRKHGVSPNTVKKIIADNPDTERKCAQKKEQNTADILAYMDETAADTKRLIGKLLQGMERNLDVTTNLRDIATAYGIVVDKMFKVEELRQAQNSTVSEELSLWVDAVMINEEHLQ